MRECAKRGELWFLGYAAEGARLPKPVGKGSMVIPSPSGEFHVPSPREQHLLAVWPERLGKLELNNRFLWNSQLGIKRWQIYNEEGNPTEVK